jgi:hypothetical protein
MRSRVSSNDLAARLGGEQLAMPPSNSAEFGRESA